jgi:hypothetical protein
MRRGQIKRLSALEARHGVEQFYHLPLSEWPEWALLAEVAEGISENEGRTVTPEEVDAMSREERRRRLGITD